MVLSGCALPPQQPVSLTEGALRSNSGKVGVAMTALPKIDTYFPGAECLLCYALANAVNHSLTAHAQALPAQELSALKADVTALLRKREVDAVMIDGDIDLKALPDLRPDEGTQARKNFASVRTQHGLDQLLVVDFHSAGYVRTYASYIPTSDPKAMLTGAGYLVDLKTNSYLWYVPIDLELSAEGEWDEAPDFPGLTNAFYQAVEASREAILKPLAPPRAGTGTASAASASSATNATDATDATDAATATEKPVAVVAPVAPVATSAP